MWGVCIGCGERGFSCDQDLVCVSGGCNVWNIIIVTYAILLAMSRMGFLVSS